MNYAIEECEKLERGGEREIRIHTYTYAHIRTETEPNYALSVCLIHGAAWMQNHANKSLWRLHNQL